jgi:hypothetical protein
MDRLIRQNQEVHEDNTRLEEEMSEMEKQLVETKMQYAEVCHVVLSLLPNPDFQTGQRSARNHVPQIQRYEKGSRPRLDIVPPSPSLSSPNLVFTIITNNHITTCIALLQFFFVCSRKSSPYEALRLLHQ